MLIRPRRWLNTMQKNTRRMTTVIGVILLIFLSAVTILSGSILYDWALEDWQEDLHGFATVLSENTSQTMASAYLVLDSIADSVDVALLPDASQLSAVFGTRQAHLMLRDKISGLPQVSVASIVGADGKLVNFSDAYPPPGIDVSDRAPFIYHRDHANELPFLSQATISRYASRPTMYVSRRLSDARGRFIGTAVVAIPCDFFNNIFKNIGLEKKLSIALFQENNAVVATWPPPKNISGASALGTTQNLRFRADDLSLSTKVRGYPLILRVSVAHEVFMEDWLRTMRLLGGIAIVSFLVVAGAFAVVALLVKRRELDAEDALTLKALADSANEDKSRFLAMMSHEIRTPMNGMIGLSELLLESRLDATQHGYAHGVHQSAINLMHIINDVLDFSKIESGHLTIEETTFNPMRQLNELVSLYKATADKKQLTLDVRHDPADNIDVIGDSHRIAQILGNLLNNAIKFTPAGEVVISFSVQRHPGHGKAVQLNYAVSDSGIGISEDVQDRLFEPFHQADNTISRKYGGTGLGLAICKRLAKLMGGQITCCSVPDKGSTFVFSVPSRIDDLAPQASPVPDLPLPTPPAGAGSRPCHILLAEDNAMNRQLVRALLTRNGYILDEVENGQLALEAIEKTSYDLVLMDCMMPVMDGYAATTSLRRREAALALKRLPIIALTASAIEGDKTLCLAAGMDDYLAKPFTGKSLLAIVARWTGPAPAAAH
jgi:signal transduction histidine kinase/ActR/RegA family two-component response regulator